jgi:hypothetical protein
MTRKSPEQEAFENQKRGQQPPRDESRNPEPPPGMESMEKERGKEAGPAPLARDHIGGRS